MLPPQAEGKEGPGEVAGCEARVEALDLNHAYKEPCSERCEQSLHLGGARMSKLHLV